MNRGYYAIFYAALALFERGAEAPRRHKRAVALFDSEYVRTGIFPREMHKDFARAFQLRQESDYQDLRTVSREEAEEIVARAERFLAAVEKYLIGLGYPL